MGFRGQAFRFDSPDEAIAGMLDRLGAHKPIPPARPPELVPLADARARILAEPIIADRDSPPFDYSAMDGYAARASDLQALASAGAGPIDLPVVGESRIGEAPPPLPPGPPAAAIRIATGAAMPLGADAIIRREDAAEHAAPDAGVERITIPAAVAAGARPGEHVRRRGENARAGAVVLEAGRLISPAAMGALAGVGCTRVPVRPSLRIGIITTGEEVVGPQETPGPFQIRDSNGPSVAAAVASMAWAEVVRLPHARDAADLGPILREAIAASDSVVLTGGVSMGHRDPVREAIEALASGKPSGGGSAPALDIVFHGLPQRPGKPMLGAVLHRPGNADPPTPIFGLPGNPVSALVTCTRIVLPVLAAHAGASPGRGRFGPGGAIPVRISNADDRTLPLWWHRLARWTDERGEPRVELLDVRGSGDIVCAGISDGFVEVPPTGVAGGLPTERSWFYPWPGAVW